MTLPSVSLRANPSTAVTSAEPVTSSPALIPASQRTTSSATANIRQRRTSTKIFGIGRVKRSQAETTTKSRDDWRNDARRRNRWTWWATPWSASATLGNGKMMIAINGIIDSARSAIDNQESQRRPRGAVRRKATTAASARIPSLTAMPSDQKMSWSRGPSGATATIIGGSVGSPLHRPVGMKEGKKGVRVGSQRPAGKDHGPGRAPWQRGRGQLCGGSREQAIQVDSRTDSRGTSPVTAAPGAPRGAAVVAGGLFPAESPGGECGGAGWTFRAASATFWSFVLGISSSSGFVWSSSRFVNGRAFRRRFAVSASWSSAAASRKRCGGASSSRSRARPVAAPASGQNGVRSAIASSAFDDSGPESVVRRPISSRLFFCHAFRMIFMHFAWPRPNRAPRRARVLRGSAIRC